MKQPMSSSLFLDLESFGEAKKPASLVLELNLLRKYFACIRCKELRPAAVSTSYISRIQDIVYHCKNVLVASYCNASEFNLNGQVLSGPDFAAINVGAS